LFSAYFNFFNGYRTKINTLPQCNGAGAAGAVLLLLLLLLKTPLKIIY